MTNRRALGTLAVVTLAAVVLRAIGLDHGLWFDEIVTLIQSVRPSFSTIVTQFPGANNHPLYSAAAHLSVAAFGEHAWSLRLPALLFGVAAVPLLFALGAVVSDRREALLGAALLAVSYHHIWFSQNARGYTALLFWTLLATVAFIRGWQDGRRRWFVLHGLAIALGLYTHLTMAFVAAAHGAVWVFLLARPGVLANAGRGWRLPATAVLVATAVTALLYAPTMGQVYGTFSHAAPAAAREVATTRWAAWELLKGLRIGLGGVGALGGLALAVWGAWSYLRRQPLAFVLFVLPAIVTGLGILALRFPVRPRFFFALLGFGVLFIIRGAMEMGQAAIRLAPAASERTRAIAGVAAASVIIAASLASVPRGYALPKQDFDGALRHIDLRRTSGEPVLTGGLASYPYREFYGRSWTAVTTADDVHRADVGAARVWLVYSFPEYMDRRLVAMIRQDCHSPRAFGGTLGGGDVVVCTLRRRRN